MTTVATKHKSYVDRFGPAIPASQITPTPQRFIWRPYIPVGEVTLLEGHSDVGKTWVIVSIAAHLSAGRPLPGQATGDARPMRVLFANAEDEPDRVLTPRLIAAQANLDNVLFPPKRIREGEAGIDWLGDYIQNVGAAIVFLDPLMDYSGGLDPNKAEGVRAQLQAVKRIANNVGCSIIAVRHFRKGESELQDLEKGSGSMQFNAVARSTVQVQRAPDGVRVFKHIKGNYDRRGDALAFDLETVELPSGIVSARVVWKGPVDPDLAVSKTPKQRTVAADFIKEFLADGPQTALAVFEEAGKRGISAKTLKRAKTGVARSEYRMGQWEWTLLPSPAENG